MPLRRFSPTQLVSYDPGSGLVTSQLKNSSLVIFSTCGEYGWRLEHFLHTSLFSQSYGDAELGIRLPRMQGCWR
jgi:hypothetical protein